MYELTANALQTVLENQNILFTEVPVCSCNNSIVYREGSGLVTLRGLTSCQCRARFRVSFGGNIAVPAEGTVGPVSIAIAINGEAVNSTTATVTPTAAEAFNNVSTDVFIDVPAGCCSQISVKNVTAGESTLVQNANLIIERVA